MPSPAEALGLSGATLETRLRQATRRISDGALQRIARRLDDDGKLNGLIYERGNVVEPVRVMLRPLLVMPEQLAYVHHVCARIQDALKRLPMLYLNDPDVRRVLRISGSEEAWLRDAWTPQHASINLAIDSTSHTKAVKGFVINQFYTHSITPLGYHFCNPKLL